MKQQDIDQLMNCKELQEGNSKLSLIQTHISWVILTEKHAYKIKKPVDFKFLDFSTLEKRKHFCKREVELNKRLAGDMYLRSIPIYKKNDKYSFINQEGEIVDYAVLMTRMDTSREMDKLLLNNQVTDREIEKLAKKIAEFHQESTIIKKAIDIDAIKSRFNDIENVLKLIISPLAETFHHVINDAIEISNLFLEKHHLYIQERAVNGFVRDVHGDLHMGNIFLYDEPVIFDCIEFNDQLREMDILDEIAFLGMDLDAYGRNDLSEHFHKFYHQYSGNKESIETALIFKYFKYYRANIRAKVYLLNALEMSDPMLYEEKIKSAERYINLIKQYSFEF
ncbi:hypothetical protein [Pedobacter immunditicola]|uniref:hypothetical protein n=1 Tax=Pedobacter immunditicola TaxID=3133440 RepID=UPI0030AF7DAD